MILSRSVTTFSQEECQAMNYETATIFRGRKFLWQKSIKKKKNSKYSLRHLISLSRKERWKEGSSLSQASGCGSASWVLPAFGPSLDFETTFENMEAARPFLLLMFQKKVVTW